MSVAENSVVRAGSDGNNVVRPLRVLVPLIKEELEAGNVAGMEHYRRAGTYLLEAKAQLDHGEWGPWLERNFDLVPRTANYYMRLVVVEKRSKRSFSSLTQAVRDPNRPPGHVWAAPVQKILATRVNVQRLMQDQQDKGKEERLVRELLHRMIDIGYKVLATKLHPDKGGSAEAMARLNRARKIGKEAM